MMRGLQNSFGIPKWCTHYLFRVYGSRIVPPIMENQMEKNMDGDWNGQVGLHISVTLLQSHIVGSFDLPFLA